MKKLLLCLVFFCFFPFFAFAAEWSEISDKKSYIDALLYCSNLDKDGYAWQLPTRKELLSLSNKYDRGQFWTRDSSPDPNQASYFDFSSKKMNEYEYLEEKIAVICVRKVIQNERIESGANIVEEKYRGLGLMWSSLSSNKMTLSDAGEYCRNLSEGGFPDWHLPTIDELRTLIENCPQTVTGGTCKEISSSCSCENRLPGYYSKFDDEGKLWSSSTSSYYNRHYGMHTYWWYVDFNSGGFGSSDSSNIVAGVRCVRTKTYKDDQYLKREKEKYTIKQTEIAEEKKAEHLNENRRGGDIMWSDRSSVTMNWSNAKQYCKNLSERGFSDWRLPNIDELRMLIQNCSKTETDGSCKMSEISGCLSASCWEPRGSCYCDERKNNGGYYSKFGDSNNTWLWSSSTNSQVSGFIWCVYFSNAGIHHYYNKRDDGYVRCVR